MDLLQKTIYQQVIFVFKSSVDNPFILENWICYRCEHFLNNHKIINCSFCQEQKGIVKLFKIRAKNTEKKVDMAVHLFCIKWLNGITYKE